MFAKKSAWFSKSCSREAAQKWVQNGGEMESRMMAQFIFSEDWDYEDTKDLYNSEEYLQQHLAIFSSNYVIDAVRCGLGQVSLGKYFLIPPAVEECLKYKDRRKVSLPSTAKANPSTSRTKNTPIKNDNPPPGKTPNTSLLKSSPKTSHKQQIKPPTPSKRNGLTSPFVRSSSTSESSESEETLSPQVPFTNEKLSALNNLRSLRSQKASPSSQSKRIRVPSESSKESSEDYASIPHIDTLPKVVGYLQTIYPGRDGVEVQYRH